MVGLLYNVHKLPAVYCQFVDTCHTMLFMEVLVLSLCINILCYTAGATFAYDEQKPLFIDLDFGIDMTSRSE